MRLVLTMLAAAALTVALCGCIIEPGYGWHGGGWWHHHDDER